MKLVYANVVLLLAVAVMILGTPIIALAQGTASSLSMQANAFRVAFGQVSDDSVGLPGNQLYCQNVGSQPFCILLAGLSLPSGVTVTSIALDGCFFLDFPPGHITAALNRFDRRELEADVTIQYVESSSHDIGPGCGRLFAGNNPPEINSSETIDNDNYYYGFWVRLVGNGTNSIRFKGIQVNYNLP